MKFKKKIDELISSLNHNQKIEFGIFCNKRVLDLYKKVDETEDLTIVDSSIAKGHAFERLSNIFLHITKDKDLGDLKIKEFNLCEPLVLDVEEIFDNTTENEVSMLVAQGVDYLLRYLLNNDGRYIRSISINTIEILNQLKSHEYYQESDDDDKLDDYLNPIYEEELRIQIKGLEYIRKDDLNSLDKLISKSKINFKKNAVYE